MKKPKLHREVLLQRKRERKRIKRLRLGKSFQGTFSTFNKEQIFHESVDRKKISLFHSELHSFFVEKKFLTSKEDASPLIVFPPDFSLYKNYDVAIDIIRHFVASMFNNKGKEITLDFSNCTFVDQPALFILQILRIEFQNELEKLNTQLKLLSSKPSFKFVQSKNEKVNKLLLVTGIIPQTVLKIEGLMPINTAGYFKGIKTQKHYAENKKGAIGTRIVAYINHCLSGHGYVFNPDGVNYLDGLISEILNNAEDHSPFSTYYVTANMLGEMKPDEKGRIVGEINLSFLNFGSSYFDGFEQTKAQNAEIYTQMDKLYNQVNVGLFKPFTKENLFTLYALQDGISRLKYSEESRGTGTMKFINSFFAFGDYEDAEKGYHPNLTILTGNTQLICDNRYKPFQKDGVYFISLNAENDLAKLPEKSNLKTLNRYFPGTLLTVRIYLSIKKKKKKFPITLYAMKPRLLIWIKLIKWENGIHAMMVMKD